MGRVDCELSDRGRGRRRRTRQKHLGCLLPHAGAREERRYRRHRLRPLSPLARRHRSARTRQFFRLSVFDRVAAHSAVRRRRGRAARPRLLRALGRWAHGERHRAMAVPLSLDLPQALQETGGWLNRDTSAKFADYARVVTRRLGDRVKHWAIFNDPNVHPLFGHGLGDHAPGPKGLPTMLPPLPNMLAAVHHRTLAQGRAVQALRAERADLRVGTIISFQQERPSSDSADDRRAAERFDAMWNGACLDPLMTGAYPDPVAADFAPLVADGDFATMQQPTDYLGVNYYAPMYVTHAPQSLFGAWFGAAPAGTRFTAMGWPIDAGGLTEELIRLRDRYGNPELYVTENGACYDDPLAADGVVHDDDRIAYLREHLAA